jgi:hypothetical protein
VGRDDAVGLQECRVAFVEDRVGVALVVGVPALRAGLPEFLDALK